MIIGIIGADKDEFQTFLGKLEMPVCQVIAGWKVYECRLGEHKVRAVISGIGKVRSAAAAQMLISTYNVQAILLVGTAGGVDPSLNVGDVILSKTIRQYDFGYVTKDIKQDWSPVTHGHPILMAVAHEVSVEQVGKSNQVIDGNILTGDLFVADANQRLTLHKSEEGHCIEMEGAGAGVVCDIMSKPFLAIRILSDTTYRNSLEDYRKRLPQLAEQMANILFEIVLRLPKHIS